MSVVSRLIPCFIPVRSVRRRVRKNLRMRASASRADVMKIVTDQEQAILKRIDAMIVAHEQAVAASVASKDAETAAARARDADVASAELRKKYETVKREWYNRYNGVALIPGRFTEYDVVLALGATCHITGYLDANKLRFFSSPLDWTGGIPDVAWFNKPDIWRDSAFREKIDSLCNDFVDYFNPDDLKPLSQNVCTPDQYVVNMRTHLRFMHLFNDKTSLENQMDQICEKINRRVVRLLKALDKSERILFVWGHRLGNQRMLLDAPVSDKDIKWAVKKVCKKWPNKIFDFVFFEHDGNLGAYEYEKIPVCDGAYRIRSNHFIMEPAYSSVASYVMPDHGPNMVIAEALNNISLTGRLMGEFTEQNRGFRA